MSDLGGGGTADSPEVVVRVNGTDHRLRVAPGELLAETLRERLGLVQTRVGCGVGECGACTVLKDGELAGACIVPTELAGGCEIVTLEGLEGDDAMTQLRGAYERAGGPQCGFCTSGLLVAAWHFLAGAGAASAPQDSTRWLDGNLCRCTGYYGFVRAVDDLRGGDAPPEQRGHGPA